MHTLSAAGRIPAVLPETSHHGQTTKTSALQRRSEYSNDANNTHLRYGKGKCVAFHRASESGHVCSRIRTAETSLLPLCSTSRTTAAAAGLAGFLCPAAKYFSYKATPYKLCAVLPKTSFLFSCKSRFGFLLLSGEFSAACRFC